MTANMCVGGDERMYELGWRGGGGGVGGRSGEEWGKGRGRRGKDPEFELYLAESSFACASILLQLYT